MFDVGFQELVLLFVIGLLVLGPERLPKVASQLGRWVGRARRMASQLRHQLEREIALSEIEESRRRKAASPAPPGTAPPPGAPPPVDEAPPAPPGAGDGKPAGPRPPA